MPISLTRDIWVGLASVAFLAVLTEVFMWRPMNRQSRLPQHCTRAYEAARTATDTAAIDRQIYYYGNRSAKASTCAQLRLRRHPEQIAPDSAANLPQYFVRKESR